MPWNGNGHWGSGDWATLVLIVIAAIVSFVRYLSRPGGTSSAAAVPAAAASGPESPKDVLSRPCVAAIVRDEYVQKLGDFWRGRLRPGSRAASKS